MWWVRNSTEASISILAHDEEDHASKHRELTYQLELESLHGPSAYVCWSGKAVLGRTGIFLGCKPTLQTRHHDGLIARSGFVINWIALAALLIQTEIRKPR
ncbi:unnamed protein product [Cercospora beticola]|nr:unnamed protein product [Cercospora beticola]